MELSKVLKLFKASYILFFVILILLIIAIVYVLIAEYKLFKKAGKKGWEAFIPIYNIIIYLDIIGYNWYYIFLYLLPNFGDIGSLVLFLFNITSSIKLSKAFGKDTSYGVGIALLPIIFVPMLAYNKDINYVGPTVNGNIDFKDLF